MGAVNASSIADAKAQYDARVKTTLSQKPFLSRIMGRTMSEFEGMEPDEIERCIEGKPEVGTIIGSSIIHILI